MNRLEITDLFKGAYFLTRSFRIKETRSGSSSKVKTLKKRKNDTETETAEFWLNAQLAADLWKIRNEKLNLPGSIAKHVSNWEAGRTEL